mgnify:CR=1 FL=1
MQVPGAIGLVDDFGLDRAAVDLRVFIVDIVAKVLEVLSRIGFKFRISEHIAYLFQMIW